jgi:F-type H+-transporting ATPase subunit b
MTIDWWTLGIQAVNVLVLVWLLGHFFWKPVAAMIEQRRTSAQKTLADAKAQRDQAVAALAEIDRTRAGFAQEREAILAEARAAAERERAARLEDATKEAAAFAANASAALQKDKKAADDAWRDRATLLAVDVAGRLCAPLAGPAVQAAFLERLLDKLRSLPEPARRAMADPAAALVAVSPAPLAPDEQRRTRERLAEVLGTAPQLAFDSDPAVIAGLELRGPHLVVGNSWRADLQRIRTELADEHAA